MVKNLPANAGDVGLISGVGRAPGEGNGTHSSLLAWEIPWKEKPGGLQSTWSKEESDMTERIPNPQCRGPTGIS